MKFVHAQKDAQSTTQQQSRRIPLCSVLCLLLATCSRAEKRNATCLTDQCFEYGTCNPETDRWARSCWASGRGKRDTHATMGLLARRYLVHRMGGRSATWYLMHYQHAPCQAAAALRAAITVEGLAAAALPARALVCTLLQTLAAALVLILFIALAAGVSAHWGATVLTAPSPSRTPSRSARSTATTSSPAPALLRPSASIAATARAGAREASATASRVRGCLGSLGTCARGSWVAQ